uniref:DNA-3-methyladenine glycosylase II n=1 Tax=Vespula pensylvanica TaxID=30213 RepID=A0A834PDR2_VESPE|nr:hypothetical protein H0235_000314 [Vespula pensylvanica]
MKRTKRINSVDNKINHNENDVCETAMVTKTEQNLVEVLQQKDKEIKKSRINLKVLRNGNDKSLDTIKLEDFEGKKEIIEIPHTDKNVTRKKIRAVVDLKMMKEELKQLEDPPVTPWEKEICSSRLPFEFYNTPCEQLAQHLLGKVLVRRLENGTILKGRIVETEGYLGAVDKASHSYQNKVTPRNIPMYMSPGTIYIYMTYGMYHCFNISSQESDAYVLIKAVEPLLGLDYMELLRNMFVKENKKEKEIQKNPKRFKTADLCNSSYKICTAFVIDEDEFDQKYIYNCNNLWIERDSFAKSTTIVTVPPVHVESLPDKQPIKLSRYYILGNPSILGDGSAVLIRALDPLEGIEYMTNQRILKKKSNISKGIIKDFKVHELCNGPSKLCMSFQLHKSHNKYSLCTWKGLWIEDDSFQEEIKIVKCARIGIDSCGPEWSSKPLRYYIYGNKSVSKRDKKAEIILACMFLMLKIVVSALSTEEDFYIFIQFIPGQKKIYAEYK